MENAKGFWQKKEGVTGGIIGIGLLGFILYHANSILEFVNTLMENTITAIALGSVLVFLVMAIVDGRLPTLIWAMYQVAMRWLTGQFIQMNPIAILKNYVDDLKKKDAKLDEQIQALSGQVGQLDRKIAEKKREKDSFLAMANKASTMEGLQAKGQVQLNSTKAGRLSDQIGNYETMSKKMHLTKSMLDQMKYYTSMMIDSTEFEVEMRQDEYETIRKSHKTLTTAMSIIKGDPNQKALYDQTMEFVVDDISYKIGEMDHMMKASEQFIMSVDLNDAIYEEKGVKLLEEYNSKGLDKIFGPKQNAVPIQLQHTKITNLPDTLNKYLDD